MTDVCGTAFAAVVRAELSGLADQAATLALEVDALAAVTAWEAEAAVEYRDRIDHLASRLRRWEHAVLGLRADLSAAWSATGTALGAPAGRFGR